MKRLIYITILLACLTWTVSCQRDEDLSADDGMTVERTDNLPIQLEVSIGDALATRSVERAKKKFSAGDAETGEPADVIHVQSTFLLNDGTTVTRYCAMRYTENETWETVGSKSFAWPNSSVSGKFTAYYIHGSTSELTSNVSGGQSSDTDSPDSADTNANPATQQLFTNILDGQDPLRAETGSVVYGHTVKLEFKHILTHLTLIELAAGVDDELIFRVKPEDARNENNHVFNNAFRISLDDGTGDGSDGSAGDVGDGSGSTANGPQIKFEYLNIPERLSDSEAGSLIKSQTELVRDKQTREESRQVGFFLEPGYAYNAFSIHFSNGELYLSYKNSDPNSDRALEGNNRYIFNVKKSAGVTMESQPEDRWDESEDITTIVHAEEFLRAISTNSEYSEYDETKQELVQILEATTNPAGTLLKRNVRFLNPYYHVFTHPDATDADGNPAPYDFVPSLSRENVFDGGYHYIKDLRCPLFYENSGTIQNLGLSDVIIGGEPEYEWISVQKYSQEGAVKNDYGYHRTGAVATNNLGTVQNMRVKDVTIKVGIYAEDDQEIHNVGALFGVNNESGYVGEIYLSGKMDITVFNNDKTLFVPEVYVGGLAGQNLGSMVDVGQLVDNRPNLPAAEKPKPVTISVTNLLYGASGTYYIGGLAGNNTGKLSEVSIPTIPTPANGDAEAVTIDSSESFGVVSYIGGIAAKADSSEGNEISSCLIGSGSLTVGETARYESVDPYSYAGGIVGVLSERTHVFNCTTFCSVTGYSKVDGVRRASGGAFGNIKPVDNGIQPGTMMSIAAFGEWLTGSNAGCFVGEAPDGKTWADDYSQCADVKKFDGIKYVGSDENEEE